MSAAGERERLTQIQERVNAAFDDDETTFLRLLNEDVPWLLAVAEAAQAYVEEMDAPARPRITERYRALRAALADAPAERPAVPAVSECDACGKPVSSEDADGKWCVDHEAGGIEGPVFPSRAPAVSPDTRLIEALDGWLDLNYGYLTPELRRSLRPVVDALAVVRGGGGTCLNCGKAWSECFQKGCGGEPPSLSVVPPARGGERHE